MRLERRSLGSQSGKSDPSPRSIAPLPSSRRAQRRSLDSLSHVSGLNSLKSDPVVPFSIAAGIIDSNESSTKLASATVQPPSSVENTSRETYYSLSAEEAIAGLGLDQDGLNHLKKNFNLIDVDGNGMIDKVEFLRALKETDENGDIISDFTGSLVIIATHCDPNHCIPTNRFLQPFL